MVNSSKPVHYLIDIYLFLYNIIENFQEAIHLTFQNVRRRIMVLVNAIQRMTKKCHFCLRENGGQFQHHLQKPILPFNDNEIFDTNGQFR